MKTKLQRFTVAPFVAGQAMRFTRDETGAAAIEYSIIASGIAIAIIAAVAALGTSVRGLFEAIAAVW